MDTSVALRWKDQRGEYVPPKDPFNPRDHEVVEFEGNAIARPFVERHHYSGSWPSTRRRFGLCRRVGELVGVAVFSVSFEGSTGPFEADATPELGRFVLLPEVRGNGETWFVRRCLDLLAREGFAAVVSHADPVPRFKADGECVMPGHVGTIYQGTNAAYLGRSGPSTLRLLPDATVLSPRAMSKLRRGEVGRQYVVRLLEKHGARPLGAGEDPVAWLHEQVARLTRPLRHHGCHKYLFPLDRAAAKVLEPLRRTYPKFGVGFPTALSLLRAQGKAA